MFSDLSCLEGFWKMLVELLQLGNQRHLRQWPWCTAPFRQSRHKPSAPVKVSWFMFHFFHVLKASELSIVQLVLKVVRTEILELHNIFQSNKAILQSWALHVATFRNMDRRGTRWLGFKLPLCCVLSVSSFGLVHLNFLFKVNVLSDSHIQLVGSVPQNIWEPHCVTS